ncbi:MAG TPA: serine/threonine-protein kinase, partial [Pirellulaceae bacterium]|nr:serine/threonine-protein kinase [Pirellulaceae bacterium]
SPHERAAFLGEACQSDAALRAEVEGLLAALDRAGEFLRQPAAAVETVEPTCGADKPGTIVADRYKLLEQIGEGGMGTVWVAEQIEPIKRRVALKLIKPGMDSRQVLSRFEAERQALALMDHPHIARVFDGGLTAEGRPFFVMEYVKGVPITDYCDQARLPIAERLALLISVCQAVQHAHQKGIIHRDLKPSNILVCLYDGQPVPKVIDFGLAKAMHQPLTERTLYTAHGLMVGTPLYMSPEQAELNNLDVDTRTDIYSLGVLLYELLTGSTPLEQRQFKDAAFAEILRLIKEEEPARPSLKLSGSASLPSIAAQRSVEPAQLSRTVKGDLDWIVMKSLEKERSRRYETANGLARDIERYLHDEPVEACPPSLRYRLGKVLRRHRGPAIAAALVLLALLVGMVGTTLGLVQANAERNKARKLAALAAKEATNAEQAAAAEAEQRRRADEEAAAARAVRDFLQDDLLRQASMIHQAETGSVIDDGTRFVLNPTINELLDRAAAELTADKIEAKFPKLPFVQAEALKAVGDAYAGVAPEKALDHLQRAIELYRQSRGPDDPATLSARHSLGIALGACRKDREAEQVLSAVLRDRARVLGPLHVDTFATRDFLGRVHLWLKSPDAVTYFEKLRDDAGSKFGQHHIQTLKARFHLALAMQYAGQLEAGLREMESLKALGDRLNLREDHPYALSAAMETGLAYKAAGRHTEAIEAFEKCLALVERWKLGPQPIWAVRHQLGWSYLSAGRRDDAIRTFELNLAIAGRAGANDVTTMEALGWAVREVDQQRCIALYTQARDLRFERSGANDTEALRVAVKLSTLLREFKHNEQALKSLDEFLPRLTTVHGADHLAVLKAQIEKARCLAALTQWEAANLLFRETIPKMEKSRGSGDMETLEARYWWMLAARDCGQLPRAIELADDLAPRWRAARTRPTRVADVRIHQGSNLVRLQRPAEGEPHLREALAIYLKETPQAWNTANCKQWLGTALARQEKFAEAEELLVAAFNDMTERIAQTPVWGQNHRAEIAQRLAAIYSAQDKTAESAHWQSVWEQLAGAAPPSGK